VDNVVAFLANELPVVLVVLVALLFLTPCATAAGSAVAPRLGLPPALLDLSAAEI
jgi:hypothetical protein